MPYYKRSSFLAYLQRIGCKILVEDHDWRVTYQVRYPPYGTFAYFHNDKKDKIHFGEITMLIARLQCAVPGDDDLEAYEN